jgi:hypothetical protein
MFWSIWPSSIVNILVVRKLLCSFGLILVQSHVCANPTLFLLPVFEVVVVTRVTQGKWSLTNRYTYMGLRKNKPIEQSSFCTQEF